MAPENNNNQLKVLTDPEYHISTQEAIFKDIIPGAEKIIYWHDPTEKNRSNFAIIYLHGYSASRQEISPVCELIAKQLQANLFLTRLSGHGRNAEAMESISLESLQEDAREALQIGHSIGDKVIIIANSTGATLATWLAVEYPNLIHQMILLSPNFGLRRKTSELLLWPKANLLARLIQGKCYQFNADNVLQEKYWTTKFPSKSLVPMMQLVDMVRKLPLESVAVPLLVIYCKQDQVVDPNKILEIYRRITSSRKVIEEVCPHEGNKKHVLGGDILAPSTTGLVVEKILNFLRE